MPRKVLRKVSRTLTGRSSRIPRQGGGWALAEDLRARARELTTAPATVVLLLDRRPGHDVAQLVAACAPHRVVVLGPAHRSGEVAGTSAVFRRAGSLEAVGAALVRVGPVDLLVNLRTAPDGVHARAWRRLFFHVAEGGTYLVPTSVVVPGSGGPGLRELLLRLQQLSDGAPGALEKQSRRRQELAESIRAVAVTDDTVAVTQALQHLVKLRDAGAAALVNQRSRRIRSTELDRRPAGELVTGATIESHPPSKEVGGLHRRLHYPEATLREYAGPVELRAGLVAVAESSVLPDTFKWHLQPHLRNHRLIDIDETFARLPPLDSPPRHLEGSYYYFDYRNTGHYGHLMTEAIARLWGWPLAKERDPGLRILCRRHERLADARPGPTPEPGILGAFGIDPDDIVFVDGAVTVDSLVSATPLWHNQEPFYVHPAIHEVWDRIRGGLIEDVGPTPSRIFVTREVDEVPREVVAGLGGTRQCRNTAEVEEVFARHGFVIVDPGRMTHAEQAATFAGAQVVAGFGGTGMFNLVFAQQVRTVIVLNQDAYDARNEHLFAAVLGADAHYFWSPADIPHPPGGWSRKAFESSWAFDFEGQGESLERVLGSLS